MRVGLPRAMSFYYLFPLYRTFLSQLGVEFVESPPSSAKDLEQLTLCPTDEPCISVKIAFPHARKLLTDCGADAIFLPTPVSISPENYCCPKMIGLASMLKAGLGLPEDQIINPVIDLKDDPRGWQDTWILAAERLGVRDRKAARKALDEALRAWERTRHAMACGCGCIADYVEGRDVAVGADSARLLRDLRNFPESGTLRAAGDNATAVLGHAYVLHDIFGRTVVRTVSAYGPVILPEMVPEEASRQYLRDIFEGEKLWSIEGHILGSALYLLKTRKIRRMIMVSAFSCGPASVIESYIAQAAEDNGIPFISLVVDEHTGEAGLLTRLEAFMDLSLKQAHACGKLIASGPSAGLSAPGDLNPSRPAVEGVGEAVLEGQNSQHSGGWAGDSGDRVLGIVDMGTLRIPVTSMLQELGTRVVEPEPLSDGVVSLGRELAPEFICYPMVTLLGQIRSLIQKGVDRILMVQGKGRCRLGWYAQIMEQILHRAGYKVKILAVDSPLPWREKGERFLQVVREAIGSPRIGALVRAISLAVKKLAVLDRAEDILRETRAREEERGAGDRRYRQFLSEVQAATDMRSVEAVYTEFVRDMKKLWTHPGEPLRVALVGEIYVVNEPFANRDIEKVLGSLDTRVRVYRRLNVSNWVGAHLLKTPRALWERFEVIRAAGRYIPVSVGGHGQETVGETVLASRRGMDGVIHVFPFTCMPEIVAQNILVKVSNDLDIPVLSLAVSEQTGLAGLMTRLEAFCELLSGRRKKRL